MSPKTSWAQLLDINRRLFNHFSTIGRTQSAFGMTTALGPLAAQRRTPCHLEILASREIRIADDRNACSTFNATSVANNVPRLKAMHKDRYVAYYRVSTQRQGRSGLGLEAQRRAVNERLSCRGELIAEYNKIESGRRTGRPRLAEALTACRPHRATLIIAKLDRLARNVAFVSGAYGVGDGIRSGRFPPSQQTNYPYSSRGGGTRSSGDIQPHPRRLSSSQSQRGSAWWLSRPCRYLQRSGRGPSRSNRQSQPSSVRSGGHHPSHSGRRDLYRQ
jgi:hypothetical protein